MPPLCPLQATTAQCACGCWTTGRVCRRSQPTGRNMMRPFMTWPSTLPSPSLLVPAQMHLPRSSSDNTVVILVRRSLLCYYECTKQNAKVSFKFKQVCESHLITEIISISVISRTINEKLSVILTVVESYLVMI